MPTTVVAPDVSSSALAELLTLRGRVAVVTGSGQGIGAAIAARLAEAGAHVVVADLDPALAAASAGGIGAIHSGRAEPATVDVTDSASVRSLVERTAAEHGRLDIWVNNVGWCKPESIFTCEDDEFDKTVALNLRCSFIGAREAARRMVDNPGPSRGVIINMASVSGLRGRPEHSAYSSAKHGIDGLTKSLALELGPLGIRVCSIAPTLTSTPGQQAHSRDAAAAGDAAVEVEKRIGSAIPLGRLAVADDVAGVATVLASDLCAFVSGSTILVDGGATAF